MRKAESIQSTWCVSQSEVEDLQQVDRSRTNGRRTGDGGGVMLFALVYRLPYSANEGHMM